MGDKKKYYWLRLQRDFFKRHDVRIIEEMENGKDYLLFYMKLLVESIDHEGELRFSETVPYNEKMLSVVTNTNIDIVRAALKAFETLNMIEILPDETIYMTEVNKMIGASTQDEHTRESTRLRVKAFRERQKALPNNDERYSNVTCNGELEIEKDIEIDINKQKDKNISPEPSASEPVIASLILKDGSVYKVTQSEADGYKTLYRNIDVEQQLRYMQGWCDKNTSKRKTLNGVGRFITRWLSKEDAKHAPVSNNVLEDIE